MSARARVVAFAVVCLLAVAAVAGYAVRARQRPSSPTAATGSATLTEASVRAVAHLVFRDTTLGPSYGHVALAPVTAPGGPRAVTDLPCDRVDQRRGHVLCLISRPGVTPGSRLTVEDETGRVLLRRDLPGLPSRARLSPDGTMAAATAFVTGDSYLDAGFSTRTYVMPVAGGKALHLEDFTLVHQGRRITPVDRNFWGVTFVDDDVFYVTASFDHRPWLARGSLSGRLLTTVRPDAECPSLSPDGRHVAYKKLRPSGGWSLAVLDLGTLREVALPEDRSVDDQVSWLDDGTVLYGLPLTGAHGGETDLWAVAADGSGRPRLLVPRAWSPSVVG